MAPADDIWQGSLALERCSDMPIRSFPRAIAWLSLVAVGASVAVFAGQGGDVSTRRQVMRSLTSQIDHVTPQLIQTIEAGLNDDDQQVRFIAASALSQSIMRASVNRSGDALKAALRGRQSLGITLIARLNDNDSVVRAIAAKTLAFIAVPSDQAVETALVSRYGDEMDPFVKAEILQALAPFTPNADHQQILLRALADDSAFVRKRAAIEVSRIPVQTALPVIADELRSGNQDTRPEFILALQSYGKDAKPYRSVLANLLPTEVRPDIRRQIESALRTIDMAN
jgi:HEAT repeat protein